MMPKYSYKWVISLYWLELVSHAGTLLNSAGVLPPSKKLTAVAFPPRLLDLYVPLKYGTRFIGVTVKHGSLYTAFGSRIPLD